LNDKYQCGNRTKRNIGSGTSKNFIQLKGYNGLH
jgi:hypothetical protein